MNNKDKHRYDYMLDMPYKKSIKRKHMTMTERAAQFGAFRALTGHEAAIAETGRITETKRVLDEYQRAELDYRLQIIISNISDMPEVTVTYFKPDEKKSGGEYITHTGRVCKIRQYEKKILFCDGTELAINQVTAIDGELFNRFCD